MLFKRVFKLVNLQAAEVGIGKRDLFARAVVYS